MTLDELRPGQECRVSRVNVDGVTGQRLLDMGFIPGSQIRIIRNAPLVDPAELTVRGCHISIRHLEAQGVEVDLL